MLISKNFLYTSNFFWVVLMLINISSTYSCIGQKSNSEGSLHHYPTQMPINKIEIIPGIKIFEIYNSSPFSSVKNRFGNPENSYYIYGAAEYFIVTYKNPIIFSLNVWDDDDNKTLDESDTIFAIIVSDINYDGTTLGGNGMGSTRNSVIDEFGPCEKSDDYLCEYNSKGISWRFDKSKCHVITVLNPGKMKNSS